MERGNTKHGPTRDQEMAHDIELRSELARLLTRDLFPVARDALLARLEDAAASADLAERVAALPQGRRFATGHDVMVALGISSPETGR
jgi:hypothetical protein